MQWADPFGGTVFLSGLNKAFEILDRSVSEGLRAPHTSILLRLVDVFTE